MIIVRLQGGLGNQMFQYAFGRALSEHYKRPFHLDLRSLLDRTPTEEFVFRDFDLDLFNISDLNIADENLLSIFNGKSYLKKILNKPHFYKEISLNYDSEVFNLSSRRILFEGYWQSEKYFNKIKDTIRKEFYIKENFNLNQEKLFNLITSTNSVCVNFRRTDFVTLKKANTIHGVPPMDYYYNAVKLLKKKGLKFNFFVFSDDIEWCKLNFHLDEDLIYLDHSSFKGERFSIYFKLMQSCKYFIIPNSTFAWWAAWLSNYNEKIVITPKTWFADSVLQSQTQDLIPSTWLRL